MAARETGVVRQRLGGDTAAAQRLNGVARTQLGILKEAMAFGNLQQLSRTVRLGDGTEVFVQSVFGQDSVRITPPVGAVSAVGGEEDVPVEGAHVYALGRVYGYIYRWKISVSGGGLLETVVVTKGIPGSFDYSKMSDDGSVVCFGNFFDNTYRVYRWTAFSGPVLLGSFPANSYTRYYLSMSDDGQTVAWERGGIVPGQVRSMFFWDGGTDNISTVQALYFWNMLLSADGSSLFWQEFNYSFDSLSGIYLYRWSLTAGTSLVYRDPSVSDYFSEPHISRDSSIFAMWKGSGSTLSVLRNGVSIRDIPIDPYNTFELLPSSMLVSDDGGVLAWVELYDAGGSPTYRIVAWNAASGISLPMSGMSSSPSFALSRNGRTLAWVSSGVLNFLNLESGELFTESVAGGRISLTDDGSVIAFGDIRWAPPYEAMHFSVDSWDISPDGAAIIGQQGSFPYAVTPYEELYLGDSVLGETYQITRALYE